MLFFKILKIQRELIIEKNKNLILLIFLLILLSFYSLSIGIKDFSLLGLLQGNKEDLDLAILSRFPRLISVLVTGASLSIAGLIMQTITNNKFVAPSTIGIMEWSKFGILISIIFFGNESMLMKTFIAFIFTILGALFFMQILKRINFENPVIVPLVGIMLGGVISAITTFISYKLDLIQNIYSWLEGDFSLITVGRYELLYLGIPFLILAYIYANKFTITRLGESFSKNLGLNYGMIVFIGLCIVALITSTVVVTIGSIPFIGLVIPNIVSIYKGDNLINILPQTAILGALFTLICDIIGKTIIYPYEISISIVISIIGSILFLLLVFKGKRYA